MNHYYYLDEQNEQRGPVDAADLLSKGVTGTTPVWAYWMDEWTPANQVPELAPYFAQPHPQVPANNHTANYTPRTDYDYQKPNNHLVGAILSTIFCCPPFGIVSIVYASKVNPLYDAGDHERATNAAQKAKTWMIASIITGLIVTFIYGFILYYTDTNDYSTSYLDSSQYDSSEWVVDDPDDNNTSDDSDDPGVVLRLAIEYAKSSLPTKIDDGIIMTDMQLTSDCLLYVAECDEDIVDIDELNALKSEIKKQMKSDIRTEVKSDPEYQDFIDECKNARKGIAYKYVGSKTGKSCTVKIPYTEL